MAIDNTFSCLAFEKSINTNVVVESIDQFSKNLERKTVLIVDNAPTHTSDDFLDKIPEWKGRGLEIKFLPAYSPELNKIETLWRFIKYYWLPFSSYQSFNNLKANLFHILKNVGNIFKINFSSV